VYTDSECIRLNLFQFWWIRFRRRLLLQAAHANKDRNPALAMQYAADNLACIALKTGGSSFLKAPLLREIAFNNFGLCVDDRRAKFIFPLIFSISNWKKDFVLNLLAHAFWKLKTNASLESKRAFAKNREDLDIGNPFICDLGANFGATTTTAFHDGYSTSKITNINVARGLNKNESSRTNLKSKPSNSFKSSVAQDLTESTFEYMK